eukprot:s4001_g2.t2
MGELTDGQPLFAGESEVDQLFVIQKVLGPLTPEHMEMFLRNPRFLGIQFPDVSRPETLEKRYLRRMPKLQMQLLKGILVMEPRRRLSAREMLRMPWFEGIKLPRSLRPPSQTQSRGMRPESSGSVPAAARPAQVPPTTGPRAFETVPMMQPPPQEASATPSWHYEQQMRLEQLLSQLMQQGEGGAAGAGSSSFPPGRHPHQPLQQQPHQSHQPVPGDRRTHQYRLPWEEAMAHPEEAPTSDYGPPPPQYTSDVGEDKSLADGRRSRQNRRQAQEDWMDRQPGPDTRGTPSAAERERSGPFFGAGSMSATSKGSRAVAPQHGPSGVYSTGHSHAAFGHGTSSLLGGGSASGCSGGVGLCLAPGAGVGSMGGGSGCSGGLAHPGGAAVRAAEKHVSAGTGGSEEWPSTQARNVRALRENDYEDEKAVWAQGCALPLMKKAGRNQAPLGCAQRATDLYHGH